MIGIDAVEKERHVAEKVVKDVRLDDVVEFLGLSQPHGDREAPVGEVREEGVVGNQARHRDDRPAGFCS